MKNNLLIKHIRPFIGGKLKEPCDLRIEDGRIAEIATALIQKKDEAFLDGRGAYCAAGYIDIHTHGGYGSDVMDATKEALDNAGRFHLDFGTTTYLPTTMTAPIDEIVRAIENVASYSAEKTRTARIAGCHLEGPFLSPAAAGAHPPKLLLSPTAENSRFVVEQKANIRRVTVAPDLAHAAEFTKTCRSLGIQVSLGHDASIDDEIYALLEAGASSVTHLYNCTSRPSRRSSPKKHLGLTEIALCDKRITAEVIADGRHVPDVLFEMIFKLKGASKIALVSDSLSVAGMKDGDYYIGSGASKQKLRVEDGVCVLPEKNTYAGSVTPISVMVERLVKLGYKPEDCIKMGTLTPAKLVGLKDRGDLKKGFLADLNLLDSSFRPMTTVLGGIVLK